MFQSDSSLQRPIYVGGICDTRIDPCYFHVENEVQRRESVSYDGIGRYSPRGFGYQSNFPVEGMLYEQNVHGTCISGYNQNESQVQFIEDVESQPERESVCSYMTLDRLPENVPDSNRSGNTRERQYNVVSDDFQTQFENDRYCQVPYGNENTSSYSRYQSEPCVRPVSNFHRCRITIGASQIWIVWSGKTWIFKMIRNRKIKTRLMAAAWSWGIISVILNRCHVGTIGRKVKWLLN